MNTYNYLPIKAGSTTLNHEETPGSCQLDFFFRSLPWKFLIGYASLQGLCHLYLHWLKAFYPAPEWSDLNMCWAMLFVLTGTFVQKECAEMCTYSVFVHMSFPGW